ncbi:MAG: hypothetical protein QM759_14125 [Terricaulis sp.]
MTSMKFTRRGSAGFLLAGLAAATAPAFAQATAAQSAPLNKFEADRRAILAMTGDFHVRFDFRETVPFLNDYDPIEPHVANGNESVRAIEDTGSVIRLQHILVVEADGHPVIVKHWRQDWTYEPRTVLQYQRMNEWRLQNVDNRVRQGAWSQTVWQTDDSPRYGGTGVWDHADGVSAWTSEPTLRPLARRDAVRHPPYDHYRGINRHAITPTGWVHEQDNAKIGMHNGASATFVHEAVINTYDRASDYPIQAGENYWTHTKEYWAAVRGAWDQVIGAQRGIRLTEEAENGSVTGPRLMELADDIDSGKQTTAPAIEEARSVIRQNASAPTTRA